MKTKIRLILVILFALTVGALCRAPDASKTRDAGQCRLVPDPGNCRARMARFYFEPSEGRCKTFYWGGCLGVVPFNSLEACKAACE